MTTSQQRIKLRVRVEPGIPKLLVKINPAEAEGLSAKNLGEVTLRKVAAQRGHVAVLHMSLHVAPGDMLMSLKLAEMLDVEEDENVEVSSTPLGASDGIAPEATAFAAGAPGLGVSRLGSLPATKGAADSFASRYPSLQRQCASSSWAAAAPTASKPDAAAAPDRFTRHYDSRFSGNAGLDARRGLDSDDALGGWWSQSRQAHPGISASMKSAPAKPAGFSPRDAARGAGAGAGGGLGDGVGSGGLGGGSGCRSTEAPARSPSPPSVTRGVRPQEDVSTAAADWLRNFRNVTESHAYETGSMLAAHRQRYAPAGNAEAAAGPCGSAPPMGDRSPLGGHDRSPHHHDPLKHVSERLRSFSSAAGSTPTKAHSSGNARRTEAPGGRADVDFADTTPTGDDALNGWASRNATLDELRRRQQQKQRQQHLDGRTPTQQQDCSKDADPFFGRFSMPRAGREEEQEEPAKPDAAAWMRDPRHEHGHVNDAAPERQRLPDDGPGGKPSAAAPDAAEKQRQQRNQLRQHRAHYRQRADAELRAWCEAAVPAGGSAQPPAGGTASVSSAAVAAAASRLAGSAVWNAPTPQRACGVSSAPAVAESLEPSPLPSPRDHSCPSTASSASPRYDSLGEAASFFKSPVGQWASSSQATTTAPTSVANGGGYTTSRSGTDIGGGSEGLGGTSGSQPKRAAQAQAASSTRHVGSSEPAVAPPLPIGSLRRSSGCAIVPLPAMPAPTPGAGPTTPTPSGARRRATSSLLHRRKSVALGSIQPETLPSTEHSGVREPIPSNWRPPTETGGGGLERSELGSEVTVEVRRWLLGETTGRQCSQVVLDRALTVLSNFKLASGCQLEVLGGPLGAIVGGYSDADWLHDEVFRKQPMEAIREAFGLLGFRAPPDGDWTGMAAEEVSLSYRRLCLRGHPSRGGAPRSYLKLQVAMELIRAFSGEAGPLEPLRTGGTATGFMLDDTTLARELQLTAAQAEEEATKLAQEDLEEMNRALDEYILRQMCFKSEIVDEIARLHEDSAYAILGVSSDATDAEIKRAYKLIAMQCHPDKGGDKEDFQELNSAYEKIMEQRKTHEEKWPRRKAGSESDKDNGSDDEQANASEPRARSKTKEKAETTDGPEKANAGDGDDATSEDGGEGGASKPQASSDGAGEADAEDFGEEGSNASLIDKAGKAAEEASRYAKTAAEFAHQAAEAAETARRGREQGSRDTLTKSIAHSAIVLTLTVVKAVRVVGYATLDVAAQCRIAAKRNPEASGCAERAVSAMSLGLEALNAALACAEVTETTAAELQAPPTADSPVAATGDGGCTAAAERFVGAAVRASLAAASASNAAMSAAIAAVEGSRECMKAVESQPPAGSKEEGGEHRQKAAASEEAADGASDGSEGDDDEDAHAPQPPPRQPSAAEAAAAVTRRLVVQRNNNHKVLQRLNAEILGHQRNVRQFLQTNRQLIPQVSADSKIKVFGLLQDYVSEARADLREALPVAPAEPDALLETVKKLPLLVPFLQPQDLAIPVSVKARVLKMSALYDLPNTLKILDDGLFRQVRSAVATQAAKASLDEVFSKVRSELTNNVAEDGGATPTAAA